MPINLANHPPALRTFFTTEMWERYGFYVVQTLLVLYLSLHYQWADKKAFQLIGTFTALTYISPLFGGWIADHLIGQKRAIIAAIIILMISYIALSWLSTGKMLPIPLAGIAVGTGLLKPNISSLLGNSYDKKSRNRESGFTLFYLGITTGIILGTTVPSYIQSMFGWPAAFLSAAFCMTFAFFVFVVGIYRYKIEDYTPYNHCFKQALQAALLIVAMMVSFIIIFYYSLVADAVFIISTLVSIYYIVHCSKQESAKQARKTITIGLLCLISIVFWAFYFQIFSSFTLLIERIVGGSLFGVRFPPPYYVTVESIGMIVIGVFLARTKQQKNPTSNIIQIANKFYYSMIIMALAYSSIILIMSFDLNNTLIYNQVPD